MNTEVGPTGPDVSRDVDGFIIDGPFFPEFVIHGVKKKVDNKRIGACFRVLQNLHDFRNRSDVFILQQVGYGLVVTLLSQFIFAVIFRPGIGIDQ